MTLKPQQAVMRRRPLVAVVLFGALSLAACSSTVQQRQTEAGAASGVDLPNSSTDGQQIAPSSTGDGGGGAFGGTPGGGSGSGSGGTSGPAVGAQPTTQAGRGSTAPGVPGQSGAADALYPGVTKTTVSLGIIYVAGAKAAGAAVGIPGLTTGDGRAEGQALVDYLNAHGGLAGHRVLPLFYAADLGSSDPNGQDQAICAYFTQDHHAFAVVDGNTATSDNLSTCLTKAHVTLVDNFTAVDAPLAQRISGFYYKPSDFQAERQYRTYATGLVADGFLTRSSKVGVYYDTTQPSSQRILESTVKPTLAQQGIPLTLTAGVNTAAPDASWQSAVLRFKTAGVDRVLGIYANPLFFMQAADSQQYHPRYGLISLWAPSTLQTLAPPAQLKGSVGVGWQPVADVDAAHNPGPVSANERLCKKIMADAGQKSTTSLTALAQVHTCDVFFFLYRALSGTRAITPGELAGQVAMLGNSYQSAVTFRTMFPDGRPDGAAAYRIFRYTDSCSCFTYSGDIHPI